MLLVELAGEEDVGEGGVLRVIPRAPPGHPRIGDIYKLFEGDVEGVSRCLQKRYEAPFKPAHIPTTTNQGQDHCQGASHHPPKWVYYGYGVANMFRWAPLTIFYISGNSRHSHL